MANYFAVIKVRPTDTPMKLTFMEQDNFKAIKEMLRVVRCDTTEEIAEYDLMQIVGKDRYVPVASKIGNDKRLHAPLKPEPLPKQEVLTLSTSTDANAEAQYSPYTLETQT